MWYTEYMILPTITSQNESVERCMQRVSYDVLTSRASAFFDTGTCCMTDLHDMGTLSHIDISSDLVRDLNREKKKGRQRSRLFLYPFCLAV